MGLVYNLDTSSAQCYAPSIGLVSLQQKLFNKCIIPDGKIKILYYANHVGKDKNTPNLINELLQYDIGIIYVCDILPKNKIINDRLVYLTVSWGEFTPRLFVDPSLFNYIGYFNSGSHPALKYSKTYNIPIVNNINDIKSPVKPKLCDEKTMLVKLSNGELGDKLVGLSLVSYLKRKYEDWLIDVYCGSERFNDKKGYCTLFEDVANKCSHNLLEFNTKKYEKVLEISAYGIHNIEINDAVKNKYVPKSRFQRWSEQLNLSTPLRNIYFDYKVKERDGDRFKSLNTLKKPLVGIFPFSSNRTKDWEQCPLSKNSKWQQVINYLDSLGYQCIAVHYKDLNLNNCIKLKEVSPRELGYVISKLNFAIGVEAGLTHFCGLLNIPMMVFIGSSSPFVLRHYKKVHILHKGFCHSCNRFIQSNLQSICGSLDNNPQSNCLLSISVKDVIDELNYFLKCIKI